MATQGKCIRCHVRYEFTTQGPIPLRDLHCPKCGMTLARTSEKSRLPTKRRDPVVIKRR